MGEEQQDQVNKAFADYLIQTNRPGERPQIDSPRWKDLRGAFMAGARFGVEAMAAAAVGGD